MFDPIPRGWLYVAGIALALLLLSPFWVYLLQEQYRAQQVVFSEDSTNIVIDVTRSNEVAPVFAGNGRPAIVLDQFRGVQLDEGREETVRRFSLRLQNTRGMEPEIYAGQRSGEIEQLTAYFYGGLLKEAHFVVREQMVGLDALQQELNEQFGEPVSRLDAPNRLAGGGQLGGLGFGGELGEELTRRLAAYPLRRDLVWADSRHRVELTVYYAPSDTGLARVMMSARLSAAAWLRANQPWGVVTPPKPAAPALPGPNDPPSRLF